jgi:hypothetical protein
MIQFLVRLLKRFALVLPGILVAVFAVQKIFPYFDQRLPLGLAIFFTYGFAAYVLAPALVRLYRIFRPANHLPLYCITPDGFASDPLNVGIIGTRRELINAMEKAGWYVADPRGLRNNIREMLSAIYDWSYPNAPVSSLYLFGRRQDIAFEIPIEGVQGGGRHHVRFWATTYGHEKPLDIHAIDWQERKEKVYRSNLLWVGAASLDVGISFIRHNLQVTHMIDPDTDKERELILRQLKDNKLAGKIETVRLGEPYKLINRVINGSLHTDGRMAVVTLKRNLPARQKS